MPSPPLFALPTHLGDLSKNLRRLAVVEVEALAELFALDSDDSMILSWRDEDWQSPVAIDRMPAYAERSAAQGLAIAARFSAAYLPRLVHTLIRNSHLEMTPDVYEDLSERMCIVAQLHMLGRPYFGTYVASPSSAATLQTLTRCFLHIASEAIKDAVFVVRHCHPLCPQEDQQKSLSNASFWATQFIFVLGFLPSKTRENIRQSQLAKDVRPRCESLLYMKAALPEFGEAPLRQLAVVLDHGCSDTKLRWNKMDEVFGLERCGRRGCGKSVAQYPLFQCSRCKTVLYCSKAHQIEDWNDSQRPHKAWCYRTPW
ncbi:hypothetical protein CALVIDRAFT_539122 [Calocera viscosa TUFC12733]|uniref:MYND-type domain-containing protein n=1 Tax=Calocera viscosa (strain TUFC12733) TaxID=1330018 RepID=A0A167K8M8_CALVF|nr:hypothetical protein CALVIDRAFT_539122 [Calocera viscosa TUFC12733]